jgi:hypothetical protein
MLRSSTTQATRKPARPLPYRRIAAGAIKSHPLTMTTSDEAKPAIAKTYSAIGSASLTFDEYKTAHAASIEDPAAFWAKEAKDRLDWYAPFTATMSGDFAAGDVAWFVGGKLNICYNAIDRHVHNGRASQVAMIWEGDEPNDVLRLTYLDMQRKISQITNALKSQGVKKGDVVTIYMPMVGVVDAVHLILLLAARTHCCISSTYFTRLQNSQ